MRWVQLCSSLNIVEGIVWVKTGLDGFEDHFC